MWSHKILRWATPWVLIVTGLLGLVLGQAESMYLIAPLSLVGASVLAATAHLLAGTGRRPPQALAFLRSFAIVNVAFAAGWVNVIRGRGIEVWHRSEFRIES